MSYDATLSANFGSYAPTLANVRVDVNGSTISSGIATIANTGGTAFEVDVTLPGGFNGPFVFYDSADPTKYCVGSVAPIFDHTSDEVITNEDSRTASQADVATALTDIHLDHLFAADYDPASKPGVSTALLNELIGDDSGVSQFTANALENAPTGGGGGGDVNVVSVGGVAVDDPDDLKADVSDLPNAAEIVAALAGAEVDVAVESGLNDAGDLTITKNETLVATWSGLSIPANVQDIYFTMVGHLRDDDSEAIVQVKNTDGLLRLNGEEAATPTDGELTFDQPGGSVSMVLADDAIALIRARTVLHYDLKYITTLGTSRRLAQGSGLIAYTATKTV